MSGKRAGWHFNETHNRISLPMRKVKDGRRFPVRRTLVSLVLVVAPCIVAQSPERLAPVVISMQKGSTWAGEIGM
jgi:hypothetical protein